MDSAGKDCLFLPTALSNHDYDVSDLVLDDHDLYGNYGDWRELLTCIPEVVDSRPGATEPEEYHQDIEDTKKALEEECESAPEEDHEYIDH